MQRCFFDYVRKNETISDYQGRCFAVTSEAHEYAELLAIHLQYDPNAAYSGWSIVVRDALFAEVCSVPVPPPDVDRVVFELHMPRAA